MKHVHDNVPMSASSSVVSNSVDEPKRSKRCRVETNFGHIILITFFVEGFDFLTDELVFTFFIAEEAKTCEEAVRSIDVSFRKEAIKNKLSSIVFNHSYELVDLFKGCRPSSSKWIFSKNLRPDSYIDNTKPDW